jgi:hypothetical protein
MACTQDFYSYEEMICYIGRTYIVAEDFSSRPRTILPLLIEMTFSFIKKEVHTQYFLREELKKQLSLFRRLHG